MIRHENINKAAERELLSVLSGFESVDYGYKKAIPIAFNLNLKNKSAVCSTIPERICEKMGKSTHDWHPSDVFRDGKVLHQII